MGKDPIAVKEVVTDDHPLEEVELVEVFLLLIAGDEEEELGLQGMPSPVLVELFQEGIILRSFKEEIAIQRRGQHPGKRRLPDADGSLYRDVSLFPFHKNTILASCFTVS